MLIDLRILAVLIFVCVAFVIGALIVSVVWTSIKEMKRFKARMYEDSLIPISTVVNVKLPPQGTITRPDGGLKILRQTTATPYKKTLVGAGRVGGF